VSFNLPDLYCILGLGLLPAETKAVKDKERETIGYLFHVALEKVG
jgi:hypothetical protein